MHFNFIGYNSTISTFIIQKDKGYQVITSEWKLTHCASAGGNSDHHNTATVFPKVTKYDGKVSIVKHVLWFSEMLDNGFLVGLIHHLTKR